MELTAEQKQALEGQVKELEKEREALVIEANKQISFLNGRIAQIRALLTEEKRAEEKSG